MTKYEQIADILRERIENDIYPKNSLLPNQKKLVEEFSVSRMTIKKAISILTMEGLVYSQRGYGTKVLKNSFWLKDNTPANEYNGLSNLMKNRHLESKIILFEVDFPDQSEQQKLMIQAHQPIYRIIRLRILDDVPYVLEHTLMPTDLVPNLSEVILLGSIYSYIHDELNIQFAGTYRNIQADRSNLFDQEYLNCKSDDPVLEVEQVVYLKSSRPIEYSKSRSRYDQKSYSVLDVIE